MGFFKATTDESMIKDSGTGSKYINNSGIYPITINRAFVDVNAKGARTINFFVNYNDQDQVIYGNLRLDNNNGDANEIGTEVFNKLCIIAGVEDIEDPETEELPIGKKGAGKDVDVLSEFNDIEVQMHIQLEYGTYNGNITEKTNIRGFYAADGATAQEIVNDTEHGVSLQKTIDNGYDVKVTYNDGMTEELVKAWIEAKRPKQSVGSSTALKTVAPSFGKKKFGQK